VGFLATLITAATERSMTPINSPCNILITNQLELTVNFPAITPRTPSWTWYVIEGSPVDENGYCDTDKPKVDFLFFGLVNGIEVELGYFSLSELESARGLFGLPVERDLYFRPTRLSEVKSLCGV